MKIGDPLDRSVQHGPQNHKAHLDKLVEYCETGLKEVKISYLPLTIFYFNLTGGKASAWW